MKNYNYVIGALALVVLAIGAWWYLGMRRLMLPGSGDSVTGAALVAAARMGDREQFQQVYDRAAKEGVSSDDLGRALVAAASAGHEQLFSTLMADERIEPRHLVVIYMYAAGKGDKPLFDLLSAELHRRVREGKMEEYLLDMGLGLAKQQAVRHGQKVIFDALNAHERMMPIDLGLALLAAADSGQEDLFKQIAQDSSVQTFYRDMARWIAPDLASRLLGDSY